MMHGTDVKDKFGKRGVLELVQRLHSVHDCMVSTMMDKTLIIFFALTMKYVH